MKRILFLLLLSTFVFHSCKDKNVFVVEGNVKSAVDSTLYLEHRGLAGVETLDSVTIRANGKFKFKSNAPDNPEFYQLRIGNQAAVFAVDSTETLQVELDANDVYNSFNVKDSYINSQIREVDKLTLETTQLIKTYRSQHNSKNIDEMTFLANVDSALNNYKKTITKTIISNPASAVAYYAVFQKIDGYLIFDPYDRKDYPMFGAVATSWSRAYPETQRTKHLYDFTINALQVRRNNERQIETLDAIPIQTEGSLPDIVLNNVMGESVPLSSLEGDVVLLDFVIYNADFSPNHNILLNETYKKYHNRGFQIYQISLDSDEHFWKVSAGNLPWTTVREPLSVRSSLLSTYNVRELPTGFIINRNGDVVLRIEDYTKLSEEIGKLL
ncbi:MAG: DUF4369 domain-containing protein [Fermentimonas sp.]